MCHVYGHHVPTSADLEVLGVQDRGPGMGQGRGSRRRAVPAGVPAGWCGAFRAQAARAQDRGSVEPPQDPALHPFSSNVVDAQHKLYHRVHCHLSGPEALSLQPPLYLLLECSRHRNRNPTPISSLHPPPHPAPWKTPNLLTVFLGNLCKWNHKT